MKDMDELLRVSMSSVKASELLGRTVLRINEDALIDAYEIIKSSGKVTTFGVKNTGQISRKYLKLLLDTKKYVWHTIDNMAEGGRAVDINLINPLTGRPMTGSSSSTAINVLYGVNDAGIGTDGGGSILAPALSLNLFSIMAKGMGLSGCSERISTDGISFIPGLGVISHSIELVKSVIYDLLNIRDCNIDMDDIKIAVCRQGNIVLPDGSDMNGKLTYVSDRLKMHGINVYEEELPDFRDRRESIEKLRKLFDIYNMVITWEGPVELLGFGDSVFGTMGQYAEKLQAKSGKYIVKIANMLDATSVTVPVNEAASGIVITARKGLEDGIKAIKLAEEISSMYKLTELYNSYFKEGIMRRKNDLFFSV